MLMLEVYSIVTLTAFATSGMSVRDSAPSLAFLGPVGTFTHQAAHDHFGGSVKYVPQHTIEDVLRSLSLDLPYGIIPEENNTYGPVVETFDLLCDPAVGRECFIRGFTQLAVRHCLVVRRGVKLEDVEHVLSHPQALGQCRSFLAEHLPRASLVPMVSTAGAAKEISTGAGTLDPLRCAAICSSIVVTIFEELQILREDIQDAAGNATRFYILVYGLDTSLPRSHVPSAQRQALLRVNSLPRDSEAMAIRISQIIRVLDLDVLRMDRRPAHRALTYSDTFLDVYFLEVGQFKDNKDTAWPWPEHLRQAIKRARNIGVEVSLLGHW